jgi:hypothetical protein
MQRRARQEETPPTLPLTLSTQPLHIPHFPNWRPPARKQPLMQAHGALRGRPRLKRERVPDHGSEMVLE